MNDLWQSLFSDADTPSSIEELHQPIAPVAQEGLLIVPLFHQGLIEISGEGSKKFLQGQTTCNIDDLTDNTWLPGAFCDPKGRMITNFSLFQVNPDKLLMQVHSGLVEKTLQAVQKFSLFFKTSLRDATECYASIGLMGNDASSAVSQLLKQAAPAPGGVIAYEDCLAATLTDQRNILVIPAEKLPTVWQQLIPLGLIANPQRWNLASIQMGIGQITPETSGELIPQMINLQAVGGVSFKKGCYTGQEIVARMKYLGKLKRRMYRVEIAGDQQMNPGEPCFTEEHSGNQGVVVNAVNTGTTVEALIVMTEELKQAEKIKVGARSASAFKLLPLPYELD